MEEYSRQRAEEQAILKAARQARQEQEKMANKITAEEAAKIQERVSWIYKLLHSWSFPSLLQLSARKVLSEPEGIPYKNSSENVEGPTFGIFPKSLKDSYLS